YDYLTVFILCKGLRRHALEYYLLCGFAIILIPFMAWKQTQGIGMKVAAVISSQAARLLILYFFLATVLKILPKNPIAFYHLGNTGLLLCVKFIVFVYAMYILVGKSQSLASSLMSGGAGALGGRDVSGGISGGIAKGIGIIGAGLGIGIGFTKLGKAMNLGVRAKNAANSLANIMRKAANFTSSNSDQNDS
ncbi:MAG: hypothetical protein HUJ88_11105, partial [Fusobacterium necrophorum]|nr:hypothetical protein [Fusobacterium necrophorum]